MNTNIQQPQQPQHPAQRRGNPVGNKIGWILSGVLVLALVAVVVVMMMQGGEPSPSTLAITVPGFFEVHEVKASPVAFLGGPLPSGAGNAGDDYRQAYDLYKEHHNEIGDAEENAAKLLKGEYTPTQAAITAMEAIYRHAAAGATKKEMKFSTPQDISVRAASDPAYRLGLVGDAVATLGDIYRVAKKYEEAEKVYRTAFIMGYHMTKEDVRAAMFTSGLGVQGEAIGGLGSLYSEWDKDKHKAELKAVEDYIPALEKANHDFTNKLGATWRKTPEPGDVFAVVEKDEDPAWRVEGLLLCGVIRYTHAKTKHAEGDQRKVKELIAEHLNDPNPYIKAAAVAARDLSPEGWKQVGTPPNP
jgi:hypothetical protein